MEAGLLKDKAIFKHNNIRVKNLFKLEKYYVELLAELDVELFTK